MKNARRITTILMALALLVVMAIPALALTGGKITITNAQNGEAYNAYMILELESITDDNTTATYKVSQKWSGWNDLSTYLNIDAQGYVTAKDGTDYEAFAKAAQAYAEEASIAADATATADDSGTVVFGDLTLGYYLVDSSMGTLCSLDTTNKEIEIQDKNTVPTVAKTVLEDSTQTYGAENDAQIGDTVKFKTVISAKKGAEAYVLYDKLSAKLALDASSIKVDGEAANADKFVIDTTATSDYTFKITFQQDYLDTLTANTDITVTYSAVLTKDATYIIDETNTTWMTYGEKNTSTNESTTTTSTYRFILEKIDSTTKNQITGAQFKLYDALSGGNEIPVVKVSDGAYRVAVEGETGVAIEVGKATIYGLDDDDTYYLEEIQQPNGYNKLAARVEADVVDDNSLELKVENVQGTLLPETGGIGTTVFYVLGGLLAVGALVLLITKKRMSQTA